MKLPIFKSNIHSLTPNIGIYQLPVSPLCYPWYLGDSYRGILVYIILVYVTVNKFPSAVNHVTYTVLTAL